MGKLSKGKIKKRNKKYGRSCLAPKNRQRKKDIEEEPLFVHKDFKLMNVKPNQKSVLSEQSVDQFITMAKLGDTDFKPDRNQTRIIQQKGNEKIIIDLNGKVTKETKYDEKLFNFKLPRKPKWEKNWSKSEINQAERQVILNWRRGLAKVEEENLDIVVTPFEKNIEVWRQLWQVVERSDILFQIVDSRDPDFFRCEDLEAYVKINKWKQNFLLVNKADLLTDEIRQIWSDHFNKNNINHVFFSALNEQQIIDDTPDQKQEKGNILGDIEQEVEIMQETKQEKTQEGILEKEQETQEQIQEKEQQTYKIKENTSRCLNRSELLQLMKDRAAILLQNRPEDKCLNQNKKLVTVGFVGYPNVGKSSVINVLFGRKKVGVGSMPGKTKHFQTLFLQDDLMLCDCPGLVFPSIAHSQAHMVCNGVLPIDQIRDYKTPMQFITKNIPKRIFESIYRFKIDYFGKFLPTPSILLAQYAEHRKYYTGSGTPAMARVAKQMLKDLVNGVLLVCTLPKDFDNSKNIVEVFNQIVEEFIPEEEEEQIYKDEGGQVITSKKEEKQYKRVENDFFQPEQDLKVTKKDIVGILQGGDFRGLKIPKKLRQRIKHALKRKNKKEVMEIFKELAGLTKVELCNIQKEESWSNPRLRAEEERKKQYLEQKIINKPVKEFKEDIQEQIIIKKPQEYEEQIQIGDDEQIKINK